MSNYFIGDIHGCYEELHMLLTQVNFNPKDGDTLWLTGDLVSRGPRSLEVMRLVYNLAQTESIRMVLGNHDIHLLAVYDGIIPNKSTDYITSIIKAHDVDKLIHWLRQQPFLQLDEEKKLVMTHAGLTPQWDLNTAKQCAKEIEIMMNSKNYSCFLKHIYSNSIDNQNYWSDTLHPIARMQFSYNVFTRMRYCFANGTLELKCKSAPDKAPKQLYPWFILPGPITKNYNIIFGHWATLLDYSTPLGIYGLDTGCCWGGKLTILNWETKQCTSITSQKY